MSHNHKFIKTSVQKLSCTGYVICENAERLYVPSVMLIKYSLHAATYIRNLPFSFVLVFFFIIAFIPTRSTPNACYIKINKIQTKQMHATCQLITFYISVFVQRLNVLSKKLYLSLPILGACLFMSKTDLLFWIWEISFSNLTHQISGPSLLVLYSDPSHNFWYRT